MSRSRVRFVAMALCTAATCLGWLHAQAAEPASRKAPTKVTFHKAPSEEPPPVRERRLQRECKGRPNAGMCAGYTR
jgi:hypothetical protein